MSTDTNILGVTRPLRAVQVWCPVKPCRGAVTFEFPCYRPVYVPEESCPIHPLTDELLFRLGQQAYHGYRLSTPYLWVDSWEGDPR